MGQALDISPSKIEKAKEFTPKSLSSQVRFELIKDGIIPINSNSVDIVFSNCVFEHVMDLPIMLEECYRILKPGGSLVTGFAPLFYSAYGYHTLFACNIPYAHLLFGIKGIKACLEKTRQKELSIKTWQDLSLNCLRFDEFHSYIKQTKFQIVFLHAIPMKGLMFLTRIPFLKHLFIQGIRCHLKKNNPFPEYKYLHMQLSFLLDPN